MRSNYPCKIRREELDAEGLIRDEVFLVPVTGHFTTSNNELQAKDMLITASSLSNSHFVRGKIN
jgi:hypothetical protein